MINFRGKPLKILVVTSQTTYMPGNYIDLLQALLKESQYCQNSQGENPWEICAIASLKTLDLSLLKTIIGLPLLGVQNLTSSLITNILELPIKKRDRLAKKYGIPHYFWNSMNDTEAIEKVKALEVDIILNIRTRCIYRKEILEAPRLGCLNIHHGLLPDYRGTFCDLYALYENRPAGFSLHEMVERVDAGRIFEVVTVDSGLERNYRDYLSKTVQFEIDTLTKFFYQCAKLGALPQGIENISQKICYTKNPDKLLIKKFKEQGLVL